MTSGTTLIPPVAIVNAGESAEPAGASERFESAPFARVAPGLFTRNWPVTPARAVASTFALRVKVFVDEALIVRVEAGVNSKLPMLRTAVAMRVAPSKSCRSSRSPPAP